MAKLVMLALLACAINMALAVPAAVVDGAFSSVTNGAADAASDTPAEAHSVARALLNKKKETAYPTKATKPESTKESKNKYKKAKKDEKENDDKPVTGKKPTKAYPSKAPKKDDKKYEAKKPAAPKKYTSPPKPAKYGKPGKKDDYFEDWEPEVQYKPKKGKKSKKTYKDAPATEPGWEGYPLDPLPTMEPVESPAVIEPPEGCDSDNPYRYDCDAVDHDPAKEREPDNGFSNYGEDKEDLYHKHPKYNKLAVYSRKVGLFQKYFEAMARDEDTPDDDGDDWDEHEGKYGDKDEDKYGDKGKDGDDIGEWVVVKPGKKDKKGKWSPAKKDKKELYKGIKKPAQHPPKPKYEPLRKTPAKKTAPKYTQSKDPAPKKSYKPK